MKVAFPLSIFCFGFVSLIPVYAHQCGEGTTYEMNQCFKQAMKKADIKIDRSKAIDHKLHISFEQMRSQLCHKISDKYKGGTFQSVAYGACYVSLSKWFLKETHEA